MIECTECGFQNDDEDHFCGGCREPLQWTGRRVEDVAEPPDVAEPVEAKDREGLVERVVGRLTGPDQREPDGDASETASTARSDQPPPEDEDVAASLSTEAVARAEREAVEAERTQEEAERRAREQAEATDRARQHARDAKAAREQADQHAREEAESAERVRAELEAAQAARREAEDRLRRETEAAQRARTAAEQRRAESEALAADEEQRRTEQAERTERSREEAEAHLAAERQAMEQAQAELERAEAARKAAEARAEAEAAAAESADRAAAEAERARLAAEAKAREDAKAAEQARRAAALVARPKPMPPRAGVEDATDARTGSAHVGRRREPGREAPGRRPSETGEGSASGPAPVKPDRTRVRTRAARPKKEPTRRLRPGDLICGECGEGNVPSRNFCRRCGHPLVEAEIVRRPWWRRIIPRREPRTHAAGERPGRGGPTGGSSAKGALRGARNAKRRILGPLGKVTRVLMLVAFAAAAVGLTFNPSLRGSLMDQGGDLVARVRSVVAPVYDPVTPIAAEASSARDDLPNGLCCAAEHVLQFGNTWWHASGGGAGQSLLITLDAPTDIAKFGVIPGAGDDAIWADHPRPRELEVDFIDATGRTVTTATIDDITDEHESESQIFDIADAEGVTHVRITVTRVYGEGLESDDVAISEIRLLTRR